MKFLYNLVFSLKSLTFFSSYCVSIMDFFILVALSFSNEGEKRRMDNNSVKVNWQQIVNYNDFDINSKKIFSSSDMSHKNV